VFAYDDAIVQRYPTIRAGVILAFGLTNGPIPPGLLDEYRAEQRAASERLEATASLADLPPIAAWRRVFSEFGAKPTKYRNAAEALLRRLLKHGDVPAINTLVDIGNLVSIRYALPVAVFDRGNINGPITVSFATGAEPFNDLGSTGSVHPDPGEVIFVDGKGVVSARRWCWRQSAGSATGAATTDALIVVEGHHDTADRDAESALADLASLLASYQPRSRTERFVLSPTEPRAGTGEGVQSASR
jgi:DNA/RNA-binding domain of Phe-tRNA-synthetase-like protein